VDEPLPNIKQVGAAIRKVRKARPDELSIEALAHRADLSTSYVSDIENLKRPRASWEVVVKIIDALEVEMSKVIAVARAMPRNPPPDDDSKA
jgi:transcriptional regulator with XRE-family HTH domain